MNTFEDATLFNEASTECRLLLQSLIDTQKNLIVVLYQGQLLFFNKAFARFFDTPTLKEFSREYGALEHRFVPHNAYFHAGKAPSVELWPQTIMQLDEHDRIVSMLNSSAEPHAFSVAVDTPVGDYAVITFTDISQDLIKRIMTENDVSIDKASGAYNKDYFMHTAKSFADAAEFNRKAIGVTMIELNAADDVAQRYLRDFTSSIKSNIRQSDMLVRWGRKAFLLAYLVDNKENAGRFSKKLLSVMRQEPFESLSNISMRLGTTVQHTREPMCDIIARAEKALAEAPDSGITLL